MLAEIASLEIRIRNSHKKVGTLKCSLKFIWHLEKLYWILTATAFPPTCMALNCNHVHDVSSCVDRINVKCTPRDLWTAEQSMHRNTPYVTLAHVGLLAPQSKHCYKEKIAQALLKILLRHHKNTRQWCILNTEGYNFEVSIDCKYLSEKPKCRLPWIFCYFFHFRIFYLLFFCTFGKCIIFPGAW